MGQSKGSAEWSRRIVVSVLTILLFPVNAAMAKGSPPGMTMAEVAERASAESKSQQVVERLADGRVRLTAPMQDLEALIGPMGATLHSTDDGGSAGFHWQLRGVGRAVVTPLERLAAGVVIAGDVVQVHRAGVIEEFSADGDGIRQDFVVRERPSGKGALVVELGVMGADLEAAEQAGGQAVSVEMADGRRLHYHQLHVVDARDEVLAAHMDVTVAGGLRIVVDDAEALYPVSIDPTFSDADWTALALPGFNGAIEAIVVGSNQVFVGGTFTAANGGAIASRIAVWNGSSWAALGSGVNGGVKALAWDADNGRLYAAGNFTIAGGTAAGRIAAWNGSSWSALGSGMDNTVLALAWDAENGVLYAGGGFSTAGGVVANRFAVWNGSNWLAQGGGMNTTVHALIWDAANNRLYAGGSFSNAGGVQVRNVAVWNGISWSAIGGGVDSVVEVLAWDANNSRLYAGGSFTHAGGVAANRVAVWNGSSWAALGSGLNDDVNALAWDASASRLYAAGVFTSAGGVAANRVAVWNGSSWAALGSGLNDNVDALAWDASTSRLYAGGGFTSAGGIAANRVAAWNGIGWARQGSGVNAGVLALAWDAGNGWLYAGGDFSIIGSTAANRVAVWNGSSWAALGSGIDGSVRALAWDATNRRLYAGGGFASAGGVAANAVAVWDGSSWAALGNGLNNAVLALAWDADNSHLYAGGSFTNAGGGLTKVGVLPPTRIAVWNGTSWSALGSGMNNSVRALVWEADNSRLYAAGDFTTAGDTPGNHIAVWNGNTWEALGVGVDESVYALAWDDGDSRLFAGGGFISAGGSSARRVAVWNGTSWAALGSGVDARVYALAWDAEKGRLYVGGFFANAGPMPANHIAYWDGRNWSALGSGMNNTVHTLALDAENNRLHAGGYFTTAGGHPAAVARAQFGESQSIIFTNPGAQNFGSNPTLMATASSGLAVAFSSATPNVCTVTTGGTLTFLSVGTCTIDADQPGDATYDPALRIQRSFAVNAVVPGAPTIGLAIASDARARVEFTPPSSDGGAAVSSYTVTSNPEGWTGTGQGSPIDILGLTNGVTYTFTVTATNSVGTGPASRPSNSVKPKAMQTISFENPGAQIFGSNPTLMATASSGLAVAFSSATPNVCTVTSGGTLTFLSVGICTIDADQPGNGTYAPAMQVQQSFAVLLPSTDLQISKSNGVEGLSPQAPVVYGIEVRNAGPSAVTGATLVDSLPAELINALWVCTPVQNASCPAASGTGSINVLVDLPVNGILRFDLSAELAAAPGAFVTNSASITVPADTVERDLDNNIASDTDAVLPFGVFANGFEGQSRAIAVPRN